MLRAREALVGCAAAVALSGAACAQFGRGAGDWMTAGSDAQRSAWIRTDGKISRDSLQKPGFEYLWKVKLDNGAAESFAPPVLLNSYIGYRGFRSLAFFGLTSDKVAAVDTDLGRVEWRQRLSTAASPSGCAAAMVALTRPTTAAFPGMGGGRGGGGRGGPARSGVGEPDEGAVTLRQSPATPRNGGYPGAPVPPGAPAGRGAPGFPPAGFRRMPTVLHAVTGDGMLHTLYVSNGEAPETALPFLPPNSRVTGLMVIDDIAYAAAAPGCGAVPDRLVALDLASKQTATFKPEGGGIAGSLGASMGPDGTLYVATTAGDLIALAPKTLQVKGAYQAGIAFTSTPVVFEHKGKVLIAAAAKDGSIHVLDSGSPGTVLAKSNPGGSAVGTLVSWQDIAGTRWLLGPAGHSVAAWKLVDQNGAPALQPGWSSRDLTSPLAPIIINGVVFTASTGSAPALYALDASTGKDLWHSSIPSPVRGGGLSVGNSQVYMGTNDGTLYVFGFPMEH